MKCRATFDIGDVRYRCGEDVHPRHEWHMWEALIDGDRPAHRVEWPDPDLKAALLEANLSPELTTRIEANRKDPSRLVQHPRRGC